MTRAVTARLNPNNVDWKDCVIAHNYYKLELHRKRDAPCRQYSILRPHGNLPLPPGRRRWPLLQLDARWGSTSPSAALRVTQDTPPNQTDELAAPKANNNARETGDAKEGIYRIEGLRDIQDRAIRQDDEQIEEDFRCDYDWGKEVDGDGDYGQDRIEKGEEDG